MKQILVVILAVVLASCKGTDTDMELRRYQYVIYNKSCHNVDITEMKTLSNEVVKNHPIPIGDSMIITTEYSEDLVSPFGAGEVWVFFDDTVKYNCATHDFKICSDPVLFTLKSNNDTLTTMEYSITDDDYSQVVSILSEEQ